jgi:hypothetical protein
LDKILRIPSSRAASRPYLATFFSGSMSLLPIFADQVLKVGAKGYGILVAMPAAGALAGSIFVSVRPLPSRQGRIFLVSVAAYDWGKSEATRGRGDGATG